ncbi:MAG: hypothetical protein R8J94_05115 [Acidimicrobiia bacterium]|nr:hypothetical protein [Acidimicrobiia bacterium]
MNDEPTFRCGGYTFSLSGHQESVEAMAELMVDLSCESGSPRTQWHFSCHGSLRTVRIDGEVILSELPSRLMPAQVVSLLTRQVLDHESTLLHIHAAAVVENDQAMFVAGTSGAGKSTLCAALVSSGWAYLTDEIVSVHPATLEVSSFPKPISVKKYAIGAVGRIAQIDVPPERSAPWMVPASTLGQLAAANRHDVRTIVSYQFRQGGDSVLEPLHRATMVRELMADGQDALRMGEQALLVTSQLAARANCLSATSGDAAELSTLLRDAHDDAYPLGSLTPIGPADSAGAGPRRSERASSLILDGRALIFDAAAGQIIELDEATTTWWALFDGSPLDAVAGEHAEAFAVSSSRSRHLAHRAIDRLQALDLLVV